jgi:pyrimidine deaminase RibD-like protein
MRRAALAAEMAGGSDCVMRHGSVVVSGGHVVSSGVNRLAPDPESRGFGSRHAEVDALVKRSGQVKVAEESNYVRRPGEFEWCSHGV